MCPKTKVWVKIMMNGKAIAPAGIGHEATGPGDQQGGEALQQRAAAGDADRREPLLQQRCEDGGCDRHETERYQDRLDLVL